MKNTMLVLALTLLLAPAAFAANVPLFSITNDRDSNVDRFHLMVDAASRPAGVIYQAPGRRSAYSTRALASGVTLIEAQGRKVVLLQGRFAANGEGRLRATFLANGLSGRYKSCDFLVKRAGNRFFAQNAYTGRRITSVRIITYAFGLRTLQGICP